MLRGGGGGGGGEGGGEKKLDEMCASRVEKTKRTC